MSNKRVNQIDARADDAARQVTIGNRPEGDTSSAGPSDRRPVSRLSAGRKALVAVVAVLSIVLIGVSAWFLFLPGDTSSLTESVLQTTVESSAATEPSTSDGPGQGNAAGNKTESNAAGQNDGQASPSSGESSGSTSYSSGAQEGSSASTGGSSGSGQQQSATVTVSVSVSSSVVGGPVSGSANPTFNQGATAYDALYATGLSPNAKDVPPMGVYVDAIGGLAAGDYGGESGWKYSVNGIDPDYSSGLYVLQDGDVVAWRYVLTQDG